MGCLAVYVTKAGAGSQQFCGDKAAEDARFAAFSVKSGRFD
jgi:hypothetical protein